MATLESDEETEDTSQFRVVSNPLKSKVDILCNDIVKSRVDTDLKIATSMRKKDRIVKKLKAQL